MDETIAASEFKAKCLKIIDEVAESGRALVVTKKGVPVVRVMPVRPKRSILGRGIGEGRILGDVISPLDPDGYERD
jgi:prevent-host-death family protein